MFDDAEGENVVPTWLSMRKKVRPLHESIVKVSQHASAFVSSRCVH
jgi:hypothetical protein